MWRFIKGTALGTFEEAPCEIIQQNQDFEERKYPSGKWVTIKKEAPAKDPISRDMFMSLFGYINGENEKGTQLDMTKPIVTQIVPGSPNNTYTMGLYLAKQFQDDPPKPNNPELTVDEWPQRVVLVRKFGGYAKDASTTTERQLLAESLRGTQGEEGTSTDGTFYQVVYDPPFKMFNRRNEIWFEKTAV